MPVGVPSMDRLGEVLCVRYTIGTEVAVICLHIICKLLIQHALWLGYVA